ncbi:PASTA domain-containing protein, partial [Streptomyces cyaneofuscatus]|uniref:Stk1 family PASTA domain-containing Ser/Thr kinase n=1 Tax=Streptomyces cyaneofuscatus TaxID=66883 RepID=UPI003F4B9A1A
VRGDGLRQRLRVERAGGEVAGLGDQEVEGDGSVIPRALPVDGGADGGGVHRTSRLEMPPPVAPPRRRAARRGPFGGPHRKLITIISAVLLTLGVGAGVWYINSGQFTQVPSLLGQTQKVAERRLADEGLGLKGVERVFSDTVERGSVVDSDPASGDRIRGNGSVKLVVSRGPEIVRVPDVAGSSLADARRSLKKVGLAPGMVTREFSEDVARGEVIRTDPRAGTDRNPDTAVALIVSKGSPVDVPDVTGLSVEDATAELAEEGLKVDVLPGRVHSSEADGDIAKQSPGAGTEAAEGDTIELTVSKGPRMLDVPDITGRDVDEARATLEEAGFEVKVDRPFLSFSDTIASQSVEGGEQAPEGSTITIRTKGF